MLLCSCPSPVEQTAVLSRHSGGPSPHLLLPPNVLGLLAVGAAAWLSCLPAPRGHCREAGLGSRGARRHWGEVYLVVSRWPRGSLQDSSAGPCPMGTRGLGTHRASGWEWAAGSGASLQGLPTAAHKLEVTGTPSFLSHAKVCREARVSCCSEIPWPGLERTLGGCKLGSEMLLSSGLGVCVHTRARAHQSWVRGSECWPQLRRLK